MNLIYKKLHLLCLFLTFIFAGQICSQSISIKQYDYNHWEKALNRYNKNSIEKKIKCDTLNLLDFLSEFNLKFIYVGKEKFLDTILTYKKSFLVDKYCLKGTNGNILDSNDNCFLSGYSISLILRTNNDNKVLSFNKKNTRKYSYFFNLTTMISDPDDSSFDINYYFIIFYCKTKTKQLSNTFKKAGYDANQ